MIESLIGKLINEIYWVWDNVAGEWFTDCPVLIQLDDCSVSVCNNKFSDVAIGINDIDRHLPINWYGFDFDLRWKRYYVEGVEKITNKPIKKIELLMHNHKNLMGNKDVLLLNGVNFSIENFMLSIYNALDCNGIELKST